MQMEAYARKGWRWLIRSYYGPGGRLGTPPRPNKGRVGEREGDLCMEVVHKTDVGKTMEVGAFNSRKDIGRVDIIDLRELP